MPIQLTVFFIIIYMLLSLTIIVQSSLIFAMLGKEWVQGKRLLPVDMILTSLGISHFCRQWASMLYNFCTYFDPNFLFWYLSVIWDFANNATFWFTSLLAVFYCVKVSSFTHPIFLWLKWRISRLVPWPLLGSLLFSCVTIIPSTIRSHTRSQIIMESSPRNSTATDRLKIFEQYVSIPQQMVTLAIPFLLFLPSTIFLMTSRSQHLQQMQDHHNTGYCISNMKAHSTALRSLAIFLVFFTTYFLTLLVSILAHLFEKRSWFWAWEAVIYTLSCIHSTSLMLSSPTLQKFLKKGH
ncbi:taste receptor type 2 member 16 [Trichechus manatus latirostris]|uniref:Taste receptor type 2 n=1 Tax=Trichechus manatus latirostris TaxID=127582 RepID=A0A2Y9E460_TRIMA|nr:taste receptor type 2 member 16 [Trichechus manatus latirostris]